MNRVVHFCYAITAIPADCPMTIEREGVQREQVQREKAQGQTVQGGGVQREKVYFLSGDTRVAAWHYPGRSSGCVVMSGGFGVTKEPGTDRFAQRFHEAGFTVLAFDPRRIGESDGQPRQVVRLGDQRADWVAAVGFAATLPAVDPARVALWSFSLTAGLVVEVAARTPGVAAAIAQSPAVDGLAGTRNALVQTTRRALVRLMAAAALDGMGGLVGRQPRLVPLVGAPGTLAVLTTPDAQDGARILDPDGEQPDWQCGVAARSVLGCGGYRPVRFAARVRCPVLFVVCKQDQSAPPAPAVRAAALAPPPRSWTPTRRQWRPRSRSCAATCWTYRRPADAQPIRSWTTTPA